MTSKDADEAERISLAQGLMVEITTCLEALVDRAASLQRAVYCDPGLSDDVLAVVDLLAAHRRLVPPKVNRARSRS